MQTSSGLWSVLHHWGPVSSPGTSAQRLWEWLSASSRSGRAPRICSTESRELEWAACSSLGCLSSLRVGPRHQSLPLSLTFSCLSSVALPQLLAGRTQDKWSSHGRADDVGHLLFPTEPMSPAPLPGLVLLSINYCPGQFPCGVSCGPLHKSSSQEVRHCHAILQTGELSLNARTGRWTSLKKGLQLVSSLRAWGKRALECHWWSQGWDISRTSHFPTAGVQARSDPAGFSRLRQGSRISLLCALRPWCPSTAGSFSFV